METIQGKTPLELDGRGLNGRLASYPRVLLDLGTGDGRFVSWMAEHHPMDFFIGVDVCRENLRRTSQTAQRNLMFIIAPAQELPHELDGRISQVTIHFPWGSLLAGLLHCDPGLMDGLRLISKSAATIEVLLNSGALAKAGSTLEIGTGWILDNLSRSGWQVRAPEPMDVRALRSYPATWARRLAHGRDPQAMALKACRGWK